VIWQCVETAKVHVTVTGFVCCGNESAMRS